MDKKIIAILRFSPFLLYWPTIYVHQISQIQKVQMCAGAISKLLYGVCACTEDRLFAKTRGFSSSTDEQTIQ